MALSEVTATAKSIAKWTWKQDGRAEVKFIARQSYKGKLGCVASGQARLALSSDKREQAIEMHTQGVKIVDIAKMLNVHRNTVNNWLSKNAQ